MNSTKQSSKQKKKPKILLKRKDQKISQISKYSYLFKHQNHSTVCPFKFKQPESPKKLFIRDIFCFKKIKSIIRNDQFICLKLKETLNQRLSFASHLSRFENSSSEAYKGFAKFLRLLDEKMRKKAEMYLRTSISEAQNIFQNQLQQALSTAKGKKYACFYYGPTANVINLSQIFLSNELLTSLGYDPRQFCDDFLKYKHLFFQIFEISLFDTIMNVFSQNYEDFLEISELLQQSAPIENQHPEALKKKLEVKFDDFIYRIVKSHEVRMEEKLKAKFNVSKPKINITLIQVEQIDETNILSSEQKKLNFLKQELIKNQQASNEDDLESMKKLMHSTFLSEFEQRNSPMLIEAAN